MKKSRSIQSRPSLLPVSASCSRVRASAEVATPKPKPIAGRHWPTFSGVLDSCKAFIAGLRWPTCSDVLDSCVAFIKFFLFLALWCIFWSYYDCGKHNFECTDNLPAEQWCFNHPMFKSCKGIEYFYDDRYFMAQYKYTLK
jgi:hypothetical protein